jgi:hypothetical protein
MPRLTDERNPEERPNMNKLRMKVATKMTLRQSGANGEINTRLQDRLMEGNRCLEAYTITGQRSQETHAKVIADPEYFAMAPFDYASAARAHASTLNKKQLQNHWCDTNNRVARRYGHTEAYEAWNKAGSELRSAISLIANTREHARKNSIRCAHKGSILRTPCSPVPP